MSVKRTIFHILFTAMLIWLYPMIAFASEWEDYPLTSSAGINVSLTQPDVVCGAFTSVPDAKIAWERGDARWLTELDCIVLIPKDGWTAITLGKVGLYKKYMICEIRITYPMAGASAYTICHYQHWKANDSP